MSRPWNRYYTALLIILLLVTLFTTRSFEEYVFNEVTQGAVVSLLTPLFIIALFLERALEVFISAWREPRKQEIQTRIDVLRVSKGVPPGASAVGLGGPATEMEVYKADTKRIAFLCGVGAGILISVAGVRVLHPLVNWDADMAGSQAAMFNTVDVFLTGGLLGGGSDGMHKLVSVITDFLDSTRLKVQGP